MQAYNKIDQAIHQLAQILAKFNRAFVPAQPDDRHTNLGFDGLGQRLAGRWAHSPQGQVMLALDLPGFAFRLTDPHGQLLAAVPIEGKTQQEVEQALQTCLPEWGLAAHAFAAPLHYEIPDYGLDQTRYTRWDDAGLGEWMHWRAMANEACHRLHHHLLGEAEVRIWPHHFDTGIYLEPAVELGLGFGLAMQDQMVGAPYFYLAAYGKARREPPTHGALSHGHWLRHEHWKGAVLALPVHQQAALDTFIQETVAWYLTGQNQEAKNKLANSDY